MGVYYRKRGQIKLHGPRSGRRIERFTEFERLVHWSQATAFVILAASGLVMLFGKYVLLPLAGGTAFGYAIFGWLAWICKNLHNLVGPIFIFTTAFIVAVFVKDNFPKLYDFKWIAGGGGLIGDAEPPSGRFNAAEKGWFWIGVIGFGIVMIVTGLIMDFPNFGQGRALMQSVNIVHAIAAVTFIALALGHIYMGTIGMEGAYEAMRDGYVDEEWAREHHLYWYEEVKSGKIPAVRSAPAAGAAPQS